MAWMKLGGKQVAGNGTITTTGADTSGATHLFAFVTSGTVDTSAFGDSKSNTWQAVAPPSGSHGHLYYCVNGTVGAGHTVSVTTSFGVIFFEWWSGGDTTATVADATNGATIISTTVQPGSITPSTDGQLIITVSHAQAATTTAPTISAPFTRQESADFSSGVNYGGNAIASYVQPTAGAINPTWTYPSSNTVISVIASFKVAAGGGGGGLIILPPYLFDTRAS